MRPAILVVALAAACGSSSDETDEAATVQVGDVAVAPPSGWQMQEIGPSARMWAPVDNPRKETITVLVGPTLAGRADRTLAATRSALGVLHDLRLDAETSVVTPSGLAGTRFDLQFRPETASDRLYHRSHVVLVVGDHPVHLIYTAASPDPNNAALSRVIASIRKEG